MEGITISDFAASLAGLAVPFLVQLIRYYWVKCSGQAALFLSLLMSLLSVSAAYYLVDSTPTLKELVANIGVGFTISQPLYRKIKEKLDEKLDKNE